MAEFEVERSMDADVETVFAVAADTGRLAEWLPGPVEVAPTGDGTVHADGLYRVRPEQLRVEWGSEASPDYAGYLQVFHVDDARSRVLLHLSFLGGQPETRAHGAAPEQARASMAASLDRLAGLVT